MKPLRTRDGETKLIMMTRIQLLSKTLRSFTKSSKSLTKAVHDNCRRHSLGFFCFHHCARLGRRGDILRENKRVGGNTKSLGELMKLQEDDEDEEEKSQRTNKCDKEEGACQPEGERFPEMVRGMKLKQKEKQPGPGADIAMMEEVKERERRVKESYEALARLIEVEVMESSDLEQVLDLKEVLFNYPLIRNHLLVDLMNRFIMDVSNSILHRT